jgi:hypothetical protein
MMPKKASAFLYLTCPFLLLAGNIGDRRSAGSLLRAECSGSTRRLAATPGLHDFDFLMGEWRVHHRRIQSDTQQWVEFDGTASHRDLGDGWANIDEYQLNAPRGVYRALALRAYDTHSSEWSIRWLDGRYPSGPLGPPVKGRFQNGVGTFYNDYISDGKPMRVRFIWSDITPVSARWEQAISADSGMTWETNWIMTFQHVASDTTSRSPSAPTASHSGDFDFLLGDWRVRHRYLRVTPGGNAWAEAKGTCRHQNVMQGLANIDEFVIAAATESHAAIALRSYDTAANRWSIWWIDGRNPSTGLDPPVRGRFENGVGTFFGDQEASGRRARVRFVWSRITTTSARWEQAYSFDEGQSWETNWIMEFQRVR